MTSSGVGSNRSCLYWWLRLCLPVVASATCVALSGCANHEPRLQPSAINDLSYIDLQPRWRILVVAPILKSGGYKMELAEMQNQNGAINLKTSKDFEGYETDYYEVRVSGNFLAIKFRSGAIRRNDGSHVNAPRPLVSLFNLPSDSRYVRLLFLTRSSDRDHDQAVLAASSPEQLNILTNQVQSDPVEKCKTQSESSCIWVPAGIAVRPEKKRGREWVPAL